MIVIQLYDSWNHHRTSRIDASTIIGTTAAITILVHFGLFGSKLKFGRPKIIVCDVVLDDYLAKNDQINPPRLHHHHDLGDIDDLAGLKW